MLVGPKSRRAQRDNYWLALEKGGENGAEKGKVKDGAMRDLYVGESGTREDDKSSELATFFPSVAMRYAPGLHSLPPRRVRVVRATGAADPRQRAVSRKLQSRYYKSLMEARFFLHGGRYESPSPARGGWN